MKKKQVLEKELIVNILEELRITPEVLGVTADGNSANCIGAIDDQGEKRFVYQYPVVQLSRNLAKRLMEIDLPWQEY